MPSQTRDERTIAHAVAQIAAVGETIEVLVLTVDQALLALMRQAVSGNQRTWHAEDRDQAVELIMAGNVGVIVIDAATMAGEAGAFCEQLRSQFPDLILLVAGGLDEQTHLVKQITAGDIYRFLHKPVSPPRARQFVEAAVRRHLEGRTFTPAETAPSSKPRGSRLLLGAIAAVAVAAVAIGAFVYFAGDDAADVAPASSPADTREQSQPADAYRQAESGPQPAVSAGDGAAPAPAAAEPNTGDIVSAPPETSAPGDTASAGAQSATPAATVAATDPVAALLTRADAALAQGQLVAPPRASAFDLFRAVIALEPGNSAAQEGLDRIADQLLTNAETAMLEERIDDAGRDIDAARSVRPNNVRLAFLSAQLAKERERRLISQAREAAARGAHDRARTLIDRAMQGQRTPSPVLAQARKEIEQQRRGDSVGNLLRLANERLQQNRLVEPANDNARAYIEQALAADPGNTAAQQTRRVLADQLLARGRQAVLARDPVAAGSWISQAEAMNADRAAVRAAQRDLLALRQNTARGEQITRLVSLMNERIGQDRVLDPAGDNALHYWQELRTLDSANTALPPAAANIGGRLVQQARASIAAGTHDQAQRALEEARRIGYTDGAAVERELTDARARSAFLTDVVAANLLARDKQVAPRYPQAAERRGVEGWVEIEFTIASDGRVKDMAVLRAEPAGVFEAAATQAVSEWVYKPVMRNGRAVDQRARLRVRFDVPGND